MCLSCWTTLRSTPAAVVLARPEAVEVEAQPPAAEQASLSALLPATSSPVHTSCAAADTALLHPETSPQFSAAAPLLSLAASTAKIFPSARLNLPAPASFALHRQERNLPPHSPPGAPPDPPRRNPIHPISRCARRFA